jgi:predicted Zn-dependent peptidase
LFQKTILANGLRVISYPMPHTHSVSICIFISTGSRYETAQDNGVSHFIEHVLFKGTTKRPSAREIAEAIEGVGGILNGGTDKEYTLYWCKIASSHFDLALDVLADMLLNSRFDPREMEKERQVIIEEINMTLDSPSQRVIMLIEELLWPDQPLGRDIAGTRESLANLDVATMRSFMERQYLPHRTVVSIAGNIAHEKAVEAVSALLGHWPGTRQETGFTPCVVKPNPRLRLETKTTAQAHLCLALPGLPLSHPHRYALDLLNIILGDGMSSRLFTEIRENRGLAYSIVSYPEYLQDTGSLVIAAGVEPQELSTTVEAIVTELAKLKDSIPAADLAQARETFKGRMYLRAEDSRALAACLGAQELLLGEVIGIDEVSRRVNAVTMGDVRSVMDEVFRGEGLRLAVVCPARTGELDVERLLKL